MSARGWVALSLAVAVSGARARVTLACGEPLSLLGPYDKLIARAHEIVWAEATGRGPIQGDEKAVRYIFKVLRVFRGHAGATTEVDGGEAAPRFDQWDTTFSNHAAPEFWKRRFGRLAFGGDCQMLPPPFTVGHRYLLISGPPDLKQFERVESEDDRWLQYVAQKARAEGVPWPPVVERDHRVVQLSSQDRNSSCLWRAGGTIVDTELSANEVRKIESRIRQIDARSIIAIERATSRLPHDQTAPDFEIKVLTAVDCGRRSGSGGDYRLRIVDGRWTIVSILTWVP
jgi:hypothetical protein